MKKVKGLKEKTINKVVELYLSKKNLIDTIDQYKLDPIISDSQAKILKKYILPPITPKPKPKFDSIKDIKRRIKKVR